MEAIAAAVYTPMPGSSRSSAAVRVSQWLAARPTALASLSSLFGDLRSAAAPDFATLSVALESVRRLEGASG